MNCFYCGERCDDKYSIKEYVKKTFTNYDIIKSPSSKYICKECVWAFGSKSKIKMIDGENREGSPRNYCWYITKNKKIAYTKSHMEYLRKLLIDEKLETPFKIIISDSGQKHLIFRSNWNYQNNNFEIQFEEESIIIKKEELYKTLQLANKLSAVFGKMNLLKCDDVSYSISYFKYYNNLDDYYRWLKIKDKKISKLAAWLSKNQKEAQDKFKSINA